jgi:hypothetical protein
MSAYNRDGLSVEAYLVRVLAAICRQNGGAIRVKGELIDTVGEATALLKSWDSKTQELVLTVSMGTFGEVFRVGPERHAAPAQPIPIDSAMGQNVPNQPSSNKSTGPLDDDRLAEMERRLRKQQFASALKREIDNRRDA